MTRMLESQRAEAETEMAMRGRLDVAALSCEAAPPPRVTALIARSSGCDAFTYH